jgi:hypothetical protein
MVTTQMLKKMFEKKKTLPLRCGRNDTDTTFGI